MVTTDLDAKRLENKIERRERIYAFRHALTRAAEGIVDACVVAYTVIEDIKTKGDHMENQLTELADKLNEVDVEDTQLVAAVQASAEETKKLGEIINGLPATPTSEQIEALKKQAGSALEATTAAVTALETSTKNAEETWVAKLEETKTGGSSGTVDIKATKTQYLYTEAGSAPEPLPEKWALSPLTTPSVVGGDASKPLYVFSEDEENTVQEKGANAEWQVYTGPFVEAAAS